MIERVSELHRYEEDGAEVWFSPATGLNLRVENARTRSARRRVPRAVMFGITNHCNLRCDFCSRDAGAESHWTVDSAASLLEDLAHAGVLEVAFGGGEPFAFAGFDTLLTRLRRSTRLALSVTTNGTLLTAQRWARYEGLLSMVRMSIYPEIDWRAPAQVLQQSGQRWGANVLVDDQNVAELAALLEQLANAGAHDVSLLSYVGLPQRLLKLGARQTLARTIEKAPLPCRLSVCMGDTVPVHRLWAGASRDGDCGAGVDFVSITPDGMLAPCSFHQARVQVQNAQDVRSAYLVQRMEFLAPSTRSGCARSALTAAPVPARPAVAMWQAFSGNNSGECVLAAKFAEETDAEAFFAALHPTWSPDETYPPAWRELFEAEHIAVPQYREAAISERRSPEDFARIGRTVFATGGGVDDVFPELRALAFRKRAKVAPGGIHIHDTATLLLGVRAGTDAERCAEAGMREAFESIRHGELVFLTHPLADLPDVAARVERIAAGKPFAVDVVMRKLTRDSLTAAAKQLGSPPKWLPRMVVSFSEWPRPSKKAQAQLADFLRWLGQERHVRAGSQLWFDASRANSRVAVAAMRHGASVEMFTGETLRLHAYAFLPLAWKERKVQAPAVAACALEWQATVPRGTVVTARKDDLQVHFESATPAHALGPLAAIARAHTLGFAVHVHEVDDVLIALRQLREELG